MRRPIHLSIWSWLVALVFLSGGLRSAELGVPVAAPSRAPLQGSVVTLENVADLTLPDGARFLDRKATAELLGAMTNASSGHEVGMVLMPQTPPSFVVIEYLGVGYVADDHPKELDPGSILAVLRRQNARANGDRTLRGKPEVALVGWASPPQYLREKHTVGWTVHAREGHDLLFNRTVSVLGRRGVFQFSLVAPSLDARILEPFDQLVAGFGYHVGERYEDSRPGDVIAAGGFTALLATEPAPAGPVKVQAAAPSPAVAGRAAIPSTRWPWVFAAAGVLAGFVGGRLGSRRRRRHDRPQRHDPNLHAVLSPTPRAPAAAEIALVAVQEASSAHTTPALPAAPIGSATSSGPAPAAAPAPACNVGAPTSTARHGQRRRRWRRRYNAYHYFSALTRDLYWTLPLR